MLKAYTVYLGFDKELCEEETKRIAERNNATEWYIDPVFAPLTNQLAYKGIIVKEESI